MRWFVICTISVIVVAIGMNLGVFVPIKYESPITWFCFVPTIYKFDFEAMDIDKFI